MDTPDHTITGVTRYWMVHGLNQGTPTVRHDSQESAEREARRLAMQCKGVIFTVLEARDAYYMPPNAPHRLPVIDEPSPF